MTDDYEKESYALCSIVWTLFEYIFHSTVGTIGGRLKRQSLVENNNIQNYEFSMLRGRLVRKSVDDDSFVDGGSLAVSLTPLPMFYFHLDKIY